MTSLSINPIWRIASIVTIGRIQAAGKGHFGNIFLTFDDGPHPVHTPALLDLLGTHDARACFFLVGAECQHQPNLVNRILQEGHAIGNHSMTHRKMSRLPFREQWRELAAMDQTLASTSDLYRVAIRPPRGEVTLPILAYCLFFSRRLVLWSKDSLDGSRGPAEVVQRFRNDPVESGDRILFHDDSGVAHEALSTLLPEWKRLGFRFDADP